MARKKKEKVAVEPAKRLVIENWIQPKKENWQYMTGKKVYVGQHASGEYYLQVVNARRRRHRLWQPGGWTYDPNAEVYEYATSEAKIKVGDDDVDSIMDALILLKELIKNKKTVKSTITEVKP